MKKAHNNTHKGRMKRTSRIYLKNLNKGKEEKLKHFFILITTVVNYFVEMFWSDRNFSKEFATKEITDRAVKKYQITARLSQALAKQAKEIVRSQHKKPKTQQTMPTFRNISLNLDSRFWTLEKFNGSFDWALKLTSGFPKLIIPFNNTKHSLKFINDGWVFSKSIRIGMNKKGIWIDLIFEKEKLPLKENGNILGLDLGFRNLFATSDKELIGTELKAQIVKSGKRRKSFHYFIDTEINRIIKTMDFSNVKTLVLEELKNVKRGNRCFKYHKSFHIHTTRKKFSRRVNRLLSFWHYARATERLQMICEEQGIGLVFKDPYKTSQRCPSCGKIDRKNRNGEIFKCINCEYKEHADIVGALNLKSLQLAGVYSLRSLQSQ